jgi:RHS repeat-associated protein
MGPCTDNSSCTTIEYGYDKLYRLTEARYTGTITATFQYDYAAVGNMTFITQTVGLETTRVHRYFNRANQLIAAQDLDLGTTSYYYDGKGNLELILLPNATGGNPVGATAYEYDQRNLLTGSRTNPDGSAWMDQAGYLYDGAGDRVRQVDYTGAQPVTTTYTNDPVGLTQVLVADDGTNQTTNLFGLDLVLQDSGSISRTLLADGLGSIRTEMAGDAVETVTTYNPYGQVLSQEGDSGTVYGFTGEQEDEATGLLYLRARYYNTYLSQFMSRDPWAGDVMRPGTMHGWSYAGNNPVNWIDPSGLVTCKAPQAGCAQWVQDALNAIGNTPKPIGRQLVQSLWDKDNALTDLWFSLLSAGLSDCEIPAPMSLQTGPSSVPGFTIYFTEDFPWPVKPTDNFPVMATRPWGIYVRLSLSI